MTTELIKVYVLKTLDDPWGDYGNILVHGMTRHLGKSESLLQLERTAPFIPPVSMPGIHDVVVTDDVRNKLIHVIPSLFFAPIKKARIVRLEWEQWNRSAPEPLEYPESGAPEDYILEREHDPALAEHLGPLWQLVPKINPNIQTNGKFNAAAYHQEHFVVADDFGGYAYISAELKLALSKIVNGFVGFEEIPA